MAFNDRYMTYSKTKHRYILTIDYIKEVLGIDLLSKLNNANAVVVNSLLDNISSEIHSYLYKHNQTKTIQYIISHCLSARDIVMEAMGKQALYIIYSGDLGFSTIKEESEMSLNKYAKEILDNQEVVETGCTLTYCGSYYFSAPDYILGDY
jgi:hypothetical protein